jgi:hypothetical protein
MLNILLLLIGILFVGTVLSINNFQSQVTLVFSILSLCISFLSLYFSRYKKFEYVLNLGPRIVFTLDYPSKRFPIIILTFLMRNNSPSTGFIKDIFLKVIYEKFPNDEIWFPLVRELNDSHNEIISDVGRARVEEGKVFNGVDLPPDSSLIGRYAFMPEAVSNIISYGPGEYKVSVYVLDSTKSVFKRKREILFRLSENEYTELLNAPIQSKHILSTEVLVARAQLADKG